MVWQYIFDSEVKQRDDLDRLQGVPERLAKLELVLAGLVRLLDEKGVLTRRDLAVAVQQADLADGFEDGRVGPDKRAEASRCGKCRNPVNPKRPVCLFCGAVLRFSE